MKVLGIDFAPLRGIPFKRRMQTLAIYYFALEFFFLPFIYTFILIRLLFTSYFWISLIYFTHYYYTANDHKTRSKKVEWIRGLTLWKYMADYFPINCIKTADLKTDGSVKYIFGLHPHGITSSSSVLNFCYSKSSFYQQFPGLNISVATLDGQFLFPFHRDLLMALGLCSNSKESLSNALSRNESLGIVVGGAPEALSTSKDVVRLYLKNRKGFIKLALKHGAHLVPVYQFGENEIFKQKEFSEDSIFRKFQRKVCDYLQFSPPVFHGRGVFNYTFGFIPFRKPINCVVGQPIIVEKEENPSKEQIESLHKQYVDSLISLFKEHNAKYGHNKDAKIEIY